MEIKLKVNRINYGDLAAWCLPMLSDKLAKEDGAIPNLLSKLATMSPGVARGMLNALPEEKKNELAVYLSLIVSMALCGLWHGASWTFVVWGVYYGLLLALYTYIVRYKKVGSNSKFLASNTGLVFKLLLCQTQVMFGFMIFRANSLSDLWICIQKIVFFDFNISTPMMLAIILGISFIVLAFIVMSYKPLAEWVKMMCTYDYIGLVSNMKMRYWLVFIVVMVAAVLLFAPPETPEFIYFAF